jgi:peptidoglycan hydrolase-like protein with peptidoglycan-binding domain
MRHAHAGLGPPALATALGLLGLVAVPAQTHASARPEATASAGWHGRAIQDPRPRPRLTSAAWPQGWKAGTVGLGSGYVRPHGSKRVREVQRRLGQLGYRPGPVDGRFGPRTRSATLWFQYKHDLRTTGRVNRFTLAVLRARSEHEPLGGEATAAGARDPAEAPGRSVPVQPLRRSVPVPPAEEDSNPLVLALLLMLAAAALGLVVGFLAPELRRRPAEPEDPPAPARGPTPVLGYAAVGRDGADAHAATEALLQRCADRDWSLVELIHDDAGRRLRERPGIKYAIGQIRAGDASGLVVARLSDVTHRMSELAALLRWLGDAGAFLGAADHELDTSTRAGRATARAVIALGRWERRLTANRAGRFRTGFSSAQLERQIAEMHRHGISLRAIADALNLAGIAGPRDEGRWHPTDVKAVTEEVQRT